MKRLLSRIIAYLLLGVLLTFWSAWVIAAVHGRAAVKGEPHHNPRDDNPIVLFVDRRFGAEWVQGCGRPGTFLSTNPGAARHYAGVPWWPRQAVSFFEGPYGFASGWPLLSMSSWCTVTQQELPGDFGIKAWRSHHWGLMLRDTGWNGIPAVLPLRPIWPGFGVNAVCYALISALTIEGVAACLRRHRRGGAAAQAPGAYDPDVGRPIHAPHRIPTHGHRTRTSR